MSKKINEQYVEKSLKCFLREHKKLEIPGKQRKLPLPRGGFKSCKPDIIAAPKKAKKIYIIECKKGTNLRSIGHAFGQLYVDELIIRRMRQRDWEHFLKKRINPTIQQKPQLFFCAAFHEIVMKDKNAKKVIKEFMKKFERYGVFLVKNKNKVCGKNIKI